jgi:hypothetical protein
MNPKGKGMVINDKEKETLYVDEPKPTDLGSNNKNKDGKKKKKRLIKKIIYYDSDTSSSSPGDNDED